MGENGLTYFTRGAIWITPLVVSVDVEPISCGPC